MNDSDLISGLVNNNMALNINKIRNNNTHTLIKCENFHTNSGIVGSSSQKILELWPGMLTMVVHKGALAIACNMLVYISKNKVATVPQVVLCCV